MGLNVLNYIMNDQATMTQFIGTTAMDLTKIGISSLLAAGAASLVAGATTLAAGPLIAAIAIGVLSSIALDKLDEHFGLTDALIKALDDTYDSTIGRLQRGLYKLERYLRYQAAHGLPVGKGIFY